MVKSLVAPLRSIFYVDPQNNTETTSFGTVASSLEFPFSYKTLCTEVCDEAIYPVVESTQMLVKKFYDSELTITKI